MTTLATETRRFAIMNAAFDRMIAASIARDDAAYFAARAKFQRADARGRGVANNSPPSSR